jgi:hypothetical protein
MPEETQAFATMLYRNTVAPVQVLFDAGCTDYADDRAHIAIAPLLRNSCVKAMNLPTTTRTPSDLPFPLSFPSFSVHCGSVQGLSTWRAADLEGWIHLFSLPDGLAILLRS